MNDNRIANEKDKLWFLNLFQSEQGKAIALEIWTAEMHDTGGDYIDFADMVAGLFGRVCARLDRATEKLHQMKLHLS